MFTNVWTAEDAERTAAIGGKIQDRYCPDWYKQIDIEALDLALPDRCVWGQTAECTASNLPGFEDVTGDPPELATFTSIANYFRVKSSQEPAEIGFDIQSIPFAKPDGISGPSWHNQRDVEIQARYEMLNIAWRAEIQKRLDAAG